MGIKDRLREVVNGLPDAVTLVAVSKTQPTEVLMEAYAAGQRDFGENRVQELLEKQTALPTDIRWHLIGHLQRNKVKAIVPFIHLIHSIDSERLLKEVDRQAGLCGRAVYVLLQFHVAQEQTKFGFSLSEAEDMLGSDTFASMAHVRIRGIMGMATFTDDEQQVRSEFRELNRIFRHLKENFFRNDAQFSVLSMGMSGDYRLAVEEGSNMVRVGSAIFGNRH